MSKNETLYKRMAAERAVEFVESNMVVGLGHGSTAIFAVHAIGEKIRQGDLENICGIPCSRDVEKEARDCGIPLTTLDEHPVVNLTIDGADAIDSNLNCIKGGGGALLREKMVAQASRREIIVVAETKLFPVLGERMPVPVEVVTFGWQTHVRFLENLGAKVTVRKKEDGELFVTDQGNYILDAYFGPIKEPGPLAFKLNRRAGVVEHGLFLGLVTDVIVAGRWGVEHLIREF